MIYDSGVIAEGFPVYLNDKIQSEPSILEYNGDKIIFVGSKDDNFYSISANGEIRFSIQTNGNTFWINQNYQQIKNMFLKSFYLEEIKKIYWE